MKFDDAAREVWLSARELAELAPVRADLSSDLAWRSRTRLAAGSAAHKAWAAARADEPGFRAEHTVRVTLLLEGWTVGVSGRIDGITDTPDGLIVEELKSTALPADQLYGTTAADWPAFAGQVEVYLWMLIHQGHRDPRGRVVLASLLDGARHVVGVPYDHAATDDRHRRRLSAIVVARERRNGWLEVRRGWTVPRPHAAWRAGQVAIRDAVVEALDAGDPLLVEAPTGLGKTAAVLHGVLEHALREGKRVFWATSRNTQARGVLASLGGFRAAGLDLRAVTLRSKAALCLNDIVSCRGDRCAFAAGFHDRRGPAVIERLLHRRLVDLDQVRAVGLTEQLCPHALTLDVSDEADVIIGDVNHAMSPWGTSGRLFSDDNARGVVLVIDEVHQLVERMRDHGSPRLQAAALRKAVAQLRAWGAERFGPWIMLMLDALDAVDDVVRRTPGPLVDGSGLAELALDPWRALATRVEELALDYLRLRPTGEEAADPTLEACYALLRFVELAEVADEGTVALARVRPGEEEVRLLSLDPGPMILERVVRLGGFIGCSATLSPHEAWRAQLGLPETTRRVEVPSPFPPERRRVFVAPEVSTAWRSRQRDADATAAVVARVVENVPGNVAVFAPSFEMLESVLTRAALTRPILRQRAGATEPEHAALLDALAEAPSPVVLAAVTGGVFGEGIDLPPGALSAVVILGPALPPPDLERRLIRDHLEAKLQKGFVYAFLLPGLVRVAQAAGRLVRRAEDRGVIVLVDQRFATAGVQKYLPAAWTPEVPADLGAAIAAFFHDEQPVLGADAAAAEP